ncbi:MAG: AbrB/MazE/SpoVT family DNA-binding domain-containing protein [Candidatus Heimdallarchaeota archaeon]
MPKRISFRRRLIDNRGSLFVTIPKPFVQAFELEKGDELEIYMEGETIVLTKVTEK